MFEIYFNVLPKKQQIKLLLKFKICFYQAMKNQLRELAIHVTLIVIYNLYNFVVNGNEINVKNRKKKLV